MERWNCRQRDGIADRSWLKLDKSLYWLWCNSKFRASSWAPPNKYAVFTTVNSLNPLNLSWGNPSLAGQRVYDITHGYLIIYIPPLQNLFGSSQKLLGWIIGCTRQKYLEPLRRSKTEKKLMKGTIGYLYSILFEFNWIPWPLDQEPSARIQISWLCKFQSQYHSLLLYSSCTGYLLSITVMAMKVQ